MPRMGVSLNMNYQAAVVHAPVAQSKTAHCHALAMHLPCMRAACHSPRTKAWHNRAQHSRAHLQEVVACVEAEGGHGVGVVVRHLQGPVPLALVAAQKRRDAGPERMEMWTRCVG